MASQSLETCSHQQVLWPCIIQLVTSFKSPLKFTQGKKETGEAGGEHTEWKYNYTILRLQLAAFPPSFLRSSKLVLCTLKPESQAGARSSTLFFLETSVQVAPEMLSAFRRGGGGRFTGAWEKLHCTQPHLVLRKELCPIQAIKPCWWSWLCSNRRGTLTPLGFDTATSCTPIAVSTDPLPWAFTQFLCFEMVMAIRL